MFTVSKRSQYGIRALVYLARKPERAAPAAEISKSQGISAKYLEGILTTLVSAGLLVSERGKNGGMRLALDPGSLTMLDVVQALDGKVRPVPCLDLADGCSLERACLPRRFWLGLRSTIEAYLGSKTLKDVAEI